MLTLGLVALAALSAATPGVAGVDLLSPLYEVAAPGAHVRMASNGTGGLVFAWHGHGIQARVGTGDSLIDVSQPGPVYLQLGGVTQDPIGNFVVTWVADDGIVRRVFARRFAATGIPLDTQFVVNDISQTAAQLSVVEYHPNGGFVVVWDAPDADGNGIYVRGFNDNGTPATGEIRVNSNQTGDQTAPAISFAPDGTSVIAWETSPGIFARRYTAAGTPIGTEVRIDTMGDLSLHPTISHNRDGWFRDRLVYLLWDHGAKF